MKNGVVLMAALCSLAFAPPWCVAADFHVELAVAIQGARGVTRGSGGFWVEEGSFGRISVTVPNDPGSFCIHVAGSKQTPATHFTNAGGSAYTAGDIQAMLDFYLAPKAAPEGRIRLTGYLLKSSRSTPAGDPLFAYSEKPLDFVMANGGEEIFHVGVGVPEKTIFFTLSVEATGELTYQADTLRRLRFESEYILYIKDRREDELKAGNCTLIIPADNSEGGGACHQRKVFGLPNGDTLLFICSYTMEKAVVDVDNVVAFNIKVLHTYAVNPVDIGAAPEDIRSQKTVVTKFSRRITSHQGERIEIEIPADADNPLPFASRETIFLTGSIIGGE